jgi:hypothetical protein
MSITKRQGVGGRSSIRRLSKLGESVLQNKQLTPDSRNGRRVMAKLREKYGDDVIDREMEWLEMRESARASKTRAALEQLAELDAEELWPVDAGRDE